MKTKLIAMSFLMLASSSAFAANVKSLDGKDFGPKDPQMCGFHAEVSGQYLTLDFIDNPLYVNPAGQCNRHRALFLKCTGTTCVRMANPREEWVETREDGSVAKEYLVIMDDGNFSFINADGIVYKNYQGW